MLQKSNLGGNEHLRTLLAFERRVARLRKHLRIAQAIPTPFGPQPYIATPAIPDSRDHTVLKSDGEVVLPSFDCSSVLKVEHLKFSLSTESQAATVPRNASARREETKHNMDNEASVRDAPPSEMDRLRRECEATELELCMLYEELNRAERRESDLCQLLEEALDLHDHTEGAGRIATEDEEELDEEEVEFAPEEHVDEDYPIDPIDPADAGDGAEPDLQGELPFVSPSADTATEAPPEPSLFLPEEILEIEKYQASETVSRLQVEQNKIMDSVEQYLQCIDDGVTQASGDETEEDKDVIIQYLLEELQSLHEASPGSEQGLSEYVRRLEQQLEDRDLRLALLQTALDRVAAFFDADQSQGVDQAQGDDGIKETHEDSNQTEEDATEAAEVRALKLENEQLRKELEDARKDRDAAVTQAKDDWMLHMQLLESALSQTEKRPNVAGLKEHLHALGKQSRRSDSSRGRQPSIRSKLAARGRWRPSSQSPHTHPPTCPFSLQTGSTQTGSNPDGTQPPPDLPCAANLAPPPGPQAGEPEPRKRKQSQEKAAPRSSSGLVAPSSEAGDELELDLEESSESERPGAASRRVNVHMLVQPALAAGEQKRRFNVHRGPIMKQH